MTHYIGFVGKAGSGKDTAARILREEAWSRHQVNLLEASIASPLKALCADLFWRAYGVPKRHFYGTQAEKETPLTAYGLQVSGRQILQHVGTEGLKGVAPDVHVRLAFQSLGVLPEGGGVTFADIRFPEEARAIRARGGCLVRMTRTRGLEDAHASETALDGYGCDYVLDNREWSKDQLRDRVVDLAHVLFT